MAGEAERRIWGRRDQAEAPPPPRTPVREHAVEVVEPAPPRWRSWLAATILAGLAIGWIASLAVALAGTAASLTPLRLAAWVGLASGPLALLGVVALLMLRTGAVDAGGLARRIRTLRGDSTRLVELLALVNRRIETAGRELAGHAAALVATGDAVDARVRASGATLRGEIDALTRVAAALDDATAAARTDMGVLLSDLPDAETRLTALSAHLRDTGTATGDMAGMLAARIEALDAQARTADHSSSTAARHLAAELDRIADAAAAADRGMSVAVARAGEGAEAVLARTAAILDESRRGIAEQSAAVAAMVDQAAAGLDRAGGDAARDLARRADALDQRLDRLAATLIDREHAAAGLLGHLEIATEALEQRFASLGDVGAVHVADLAEAIVALRDHADRVGDALGHGARSAELLVDRATSLHDQLAASGVALGDTLPAALGRLRLHADQGLQAVSATAARTERLIADAETLNARLGEGGALIDRQLAGLDRLARDDDGRLAAFADRIAGIEAAVARADADARALADGATPALVEALDRMRAAAQQAAAEARQALHAIIPDTAERLAETAARAVSAAIAGTGRNELAHVGIAAAQAVDVAKAASERLTQQLLTMAETTRSLEARIAEHRDAAAADDETSFARQAGLLVEALNSTAIDVGKLLSNEPTDIAWAAYLKGDRGIFTRRAARLLDGAERKAIVTRYRDDAEFAGQVNRYVHDFEQLLRRVLSVKDGETLGVTLLSSDMGKIYVALAQSIERLRR